MISYRCMRLFWWCLAEPHPHGATPTRLMVWWQLELVMGSSQLAYQFNHKYNLGVVQLHGGQRGHYRRRQLKRLGYKTQLKVILNVWLCCNWLDIILFAKTANWLGKELGLGLSTIPFSQISVLMVCTCKQAMIVAVVTQKTRYCNNAMPINTLVLVHIITFR